MSGARSPNFAAHDPGIESSEVSSEFMPIIVILIVLLAIPAVMAATLAVCSNLKLKKAAKQTKQKPKTLAKDAHNQGSTVSRDHEGATLDEEDSRSIDHERISHANALSQDIALQPASDASVNDDLVLEVGFSDSEAFDADDAGNFSKQSRMSDPDKSLAKVATLNAQMLESKLQCEVMRKEVEALKSENERLRNRWIDHVVWPSSPRSDPSNAARRAVHANSRAFHSQKHEAELLVVDHKNGAFSPSAASYMSDPVDIDMINKDYAEVTSSKMRSHIATVATDPRKPQTRKLESGVIAAAHVDGFTSFEASLQRFYGPDGMHLTINDDHDVDEAPYMRSQISKSGVPQGIQHKSGAKDSEDDIVTSANSPHAESARAKDYDHITMLSSRAGIAKSFKHSVIESRVKDVLAYNAELAARVQTLETILNSSAEADDDFGFIAAPTKSKGRSRSKSRS